ncbi:hypothetical protein EX30DRAFT_343894 [Ascodesmis nigricans]|uniref:Uncharacterized protein n=1 Tax=Ascodesmis nigricans TaxID=341454 RepID=A0A4V3SHW0_9PEZI|nr:hypothetical protein EX30DRAFT_343894 [Ascodesmis nigricans]
MSDLGKCPTCMECMIICEDTGGMTKLNLMTPSWVYADKRFSWNAHARTLINLLITSPWNSE